MGKAALMPVIVGSNKKRWKFSHIPFVLPLSSFMSWYWDFATPKALWKQSCSGVGTAKPFTLY